MWNKMMELIRRELSRTPVKKSVSVEGTLKRLLVGFFVVMLILTILSRALDSLTIAKVTTAAVKRGTLTFVIEGEGNIEASSERFINLYEGVRIARAYAEAGQSVVMGEALFQYNMEDLENTKKSLQQELDRARLTYQKEQLSYEEATAVSATQAAQLSLQRAELDLSIAEADYDLAKEELEEDSRKRYKAAKATYMDVKEYYADQKAEQAVAARKATYEVTKAEEALGELLYHKTEGEAALAEYKNAASSTEVKLAKVQKDLESISTAAGNTRIGENLYTNTVANMEKSFQNMLQEVAIYRGSSENKEGTNPLTIAEQNIMKAYYGEEEYEKHQEEVKNAKQKLSRAKEDYLVTYIAANEQGGFLNTAQKAACVRTYEDAYEALEDLISKDRKLSSLILAYGVAVQSKDETAMNNTYREAISMISVEDSKQQKAVRDAQELLASKQAEQTRTAVTWKNSLEEAAEKVTEAKEELSEAENVYLKIKEQSFDYAHELKAEAEKTRVAERAVEDAEYNLKTARANDDNAMTASKNKERLRKLSMKLAQMEEKEKETAVEEIDTIINNDGIVAAPVDGLLMKLELVAGDKTTGAEKVSIAEEEYRFTARISKEAAKHVSQGDELELISKEREEYTGTIESLGLPDSEGNVMITAILPEYDNSAGASASFRMKKSSGEYYQTLPIQAVRSDAYGMNYVLVIRESNSVLGSELTVSRRNISILDKDYDTAAVEVGISTEEKIVLTSNKSIEEGDRVRMDGNE